MVEDAPEGGFVARALGISIFTEADTIAELHGKIRDAVRKKIGVKSCNNIFLVA